MIEGMVRTCRCNSVWCHKCWSRYHIKKHVQDLMTFDWEYTRHVVLTVDPKRFESGKEAFEYITTHKLIPNLIRNIERGKKILERKTGQWRQFFTPQEIVQWKYFVEWHANGYPHFHVLMQTTFKGKRGMIGADRLRHYWGVGLWVRETYFKNHKHWDKFTGYFDKHGYFEHKKKDALKGHQVVLPEWALNEVIRIRRSNSNIKRNATRIGGKKSAQEPCQKKTYREIIKECCQKTWVRFETEKTIFEGIASIQYLKIRKNLPGHFREGYGYCFEADESFLDWVLEHVIKILKFDFRTFQSVDQLALKCGSLI